MKTTNRSAGFTLFAFTWAMAGLFHQFSFTDWRWHSVNGLLLFAAILVVLYKPWSWQRFAIFVLVDWISVAIALPVHPNHIIFSWVINGLLLTSLAVTLYKNKGTTVNDLASQWYSAFSPWIRVMLCMLYVFTVFHKLNTSYLNLDWSCAAEMHVEINKRIRVLPEGEWARYMSIYGTLIIELTIPLLLSLKKTRTIAVILGLLFHGLLALHSHLGLFSFSATMTALFTVFLSAEAAAALAPGDKLLRRWRWGLCVPAALLIIWSLRGITPWTPSLEYLLSQNAKLGFVAYYAYLAFVLIFFVKSWLNGSRQAGPATGTWRTYPAFIIFPILIFINGLGPYFGLRTQTSFSMFSNLHTENGVTNHLIMPSGIQITDWQTDLVEIIDSNDPGLIETRDKDLLVVYQNLRRIRTTAGPDFWVSFKRKGEIQTYDATKPDTDNNLPELGVLSRRYLYFRPVERNPTKVRCKH